jgi:flagellar hook-associated protein 2
MSDISIPGVTSRFDTDKMIQEIMKLERIPLDRMNESVESYKTQKNTWQALNRRLAQFRDSARGLFGFENPFRDRIASSSRENIVTATAERGMDEANREIVVSRLASADRFLSSSLDRNYNIPEGRYGFRVGGEEISFSFSGGSIERFADKINDRGKDLLSARVVNDTADTRVLLIEGLKTGTDNRIEFLEDSLRFGLDTGILAETVDAGYTFDLSKNGVSPLQGPVDESIFTDSGQTLRFGPSAEARLPVQTALPPQEGLKLRVRYSVENISDDYAAPRPPPGPDIPEAGTIDVDTIIIENEPSKALTPPWDPPPPPKRNTDLNVFTLTGPGGSTPLPDIQSGNGTYTMEVPLSEYSAAPKSIDVKNSNTHKIITIEEASIIDPNARGDYKPANPIDQAGDAEIRIDGITVKRSENTIDDLIPGVTLNLHGTGSEPAEITVEPDRESIKNGIIKFVGYYNQLLTDIHVLTREDPSIIENLEYLTEEEAEAYEEKLGLFQGDITLNQLRSRLQRIMMDPYPGEKSGDVVLLHQIGISTNASGTGGGVDAGRLRGYLEIDESALDQSIETRPEEIRNLFGRDTDGDLSADAGVAVATDNYVRSYTQSGGIISMKMSTIDRQITRTQDNIETLNDRLDRKEEGLQRDYGRMEGALGSMEETSRAIRNLNNSNNQQ